MGLSERLRLSSPVTAAGQRRGIEQTTVRLRELVDGIEAAVEAGDEVELARFALPPALGLLLSEQRRIERVGGSWQPARADLRWSRCPREPSAPGRFWLTLRFEDRSQADFPQGRSRAPRALHQLDVELDTSRSPWRLAQALERLGELQSGR